MDGQTRRAISEIQTPTPFCAVKTFLLDDPKFLTYPKWFFGRWAQDGEGGSDRVVVLMVV